MSQSSISWEALKEELKIQRKIDRDSPASACAHEREFYPAFLTACPIDFELAKASPHNYVSQFSVYTHTYLQAHIYPSN